MLYSYQSNLTVDTRIRTSDIIHQTYPFINMYSLYKFNRWSLHYYCCSMIMLYAC